MSTNGTTRFLAAMAELGWGSSSRDTQERPTVYLGDIRATGTYYSAFMRCGYHHVTVCRVEQTTKGRWLETKRTTRVGVATATGSGWPERLALDVHELAINDKKRETAKGGQDMGNDERRGDWLCTASGRQFWPMDPNPADVDVDDIAHALAHLCRFGGHCRDFYSVAQHSVVVAGVVARLGGTVREQLAALLHDASEAYCVDLPRPLKRALPDYKRIELGIEAAIRVRFDLGEVTDHERDLVHHADNVALATEKRDIMPETSWAWERLPEPMTDRIEPMTPRAAYALFTTAFALLSAGRSLE